MSDKKVLFDYTDAQYLDPQSCGSSVRCSMNVVRKNGRLSADAFAEMKDCTRTIEWTGYGAEGLLLMERKLTIAIRMLEKLRGAVRDGGRVYLANKPKKRRKA